MPQSNAPQHILPNAPGTYCLFLRVPRSTTLRVGRLGVVTLAAGQYTYIGSAHGPGGLRARLGRHLRAEKPLHWHIDALTTITPVSTIWLHASPERLECHWARILTAQPSVTLPVARFGASDCKCPAHLFAFTGSTVPDTAWHALNQPLIVSGSQLRRHPKPD